MVIRARDVRLFFVALLSACSPFAADSVAPDSGSDAAIPEAGSDGAIPLAPEGVGAAAIPVVIDVTSIAGSGIPAFANGTGGAASFSDPLGVAIEASSGNVLVADYSNHRIRIVTPAGVASTFAGSGTAAFANGMSDAASFSFPSGVAVNASGDVYVADWGNGALRKVTPAGEVKTLVKGLAQPEGLGVSASGDVYVAASAAHRILKVTSNGSVTTFAGSGSSAPFADGAAALASFNLPNGVAVDAAANVYVADTNNHRIRRVTSAGVVTTLAGNGSPGFNDARGDAARFNSPRGIALDAAGNLYVGDSSNHRIRKLTSVGIGQLAVSWSSSTSASAPISYAALAQSGQSCTTTGATSCTITGLPSGVAVAVFVTATNGAGTSGRSAPAVATPN